MPGGDAKKYTVKHPELVEAFGDVVFRHMAGLPQDGSVVWLDIKAPQIRRELLWLGCDVSEYIVRQMISQSGLKRRFFSKSLPLDEAEDGGAQFVKIDSARVACIGAGIWNYLVYPSALSHVIF